jgi:hypothetical protein
VHHVSCGEDARLHSNPTKRYVQQKRPRQAVDAHLAGKDLSKLEKKERKSITTTSKTKCSDTASFHEHSHELFICTDIIDGYFARSEANTNNVDGRRLNESCYCVSVAIRAPGYQVGRGQQSNSSELMNTSPVVFL